MEGGIPTVGFLIAIVPVMFEKSFCDATSWTGLLSTAVPARTSTETGTEDSMQILSKKAKQQVAVVPKDLNQRMGAERGIE